MARIKMSSQTKRTLIAISLLILFLLGIYLVVNYFRANYTYNTFAVRKASIGYLIRAFVNNAPYDINLRFDPRTVDNIPSEKGVREKILHKKVLFTTLDPELTSTSLIGAFEIAKLTGTRANIFNIPTIGASTGKLGNTPQITCSNATSSIGVIWFKIGDETKIYSQDECIIVQGTDEWEIVKASDKLAMQLLTIVEE